LIFCQDKGQDATDMQSRCSGEWCRLLSIEVQTAKPISAEFTKQFNEKAGFKKRLMPLPSIFSVSENIFYEEIYLFKILTIFGPLRISAEKTPPETIKLLEGFSAVISGIILYNISTFYHLCYI
jgi:hypothetical protein